VTARFEYLDAEIPTGDERPGPKASPNGTHKAETPPNDKRNDRQQFTDPVPLSALKAGDDSTQWLWQGYFARDGITLLSALWKSGKTTLISHLLRALQDGRDFCGLPTRKATTLVVSEESQSLWSKRRDALGLSDAHWFKIRPFVGKPSYGLWEEFIGWLADKLIDRPADLIVFDTISALWPVKDENDAAQVQRALMPLRLLSEGRTLAMSHHLGKSGGSEGTASRGSGALPAFVDLILEMRRFAPDDRADHRRVLSAWGRYDDVPAELVIELADGTYRGLGDRNEASMAGVTETLSGFLTADGMTYEEIVEQWPGDSAPRRVTLLAALQAGIAQGYFTRTGIGKKGDPHRYAVSVPVF
jgi:hypothetical protein